MSPSPLRIAHRGMPRLARENTLPSFQLALEAGADGLELDVHATADGVIVIHHDERVARGPALRELTLSELGEHEAAPGIPIPTLAELCNMVAGRATLFVELKGTGIEREVLGVLGQYRGEVAIHSFDHAMIRRARDLDARCRLGVLFDDPPDDVIGTMDATGAMDVWPHWRLATSALVAAVHDAGGRVIPWTVNDRSRAEQLSELGVDGLCGDDVRVFTAG